MHRWFRKYPGRMDMRAGGPRAPKQYGKPPGLTLLPGPFGPTDTRQGGRGKRSRQHVARNTRGWMLRGSTANFVPSPPDVCESRIRLQRRRQSSLAFAYGIRAVAILRLSTHIDWSTGDASPM